LQIFIKDFKHRFQVSAKLRALELAQQEKPEVVEIEPTTTASSTSTLSQVTAEFGFSLTCLPGCEDLYLGMIFCTQELGMTLLC
jgi:hypothetical protein